MSVVDLAELGVDPGLPYYHSEKVGAVVDVLYDHVHDPLKGGVVIKNTFSAEDIVLHRGLLGSEDLPYEDLNTEKTRALKKCSPTFRRLLRFTTQVGGQVSAGYRTTHVTIRRYSDKYGLPYHLDAGAFEELTMGMRIGANANETELGRLHIINDEGAPVAPGGMLVDPSCFYGFKSASEPTEWYQVPPPFELQPGKNGGFTTEYTMRPDAVKPGPEPMLSGFYDRYGVPHAMTDVAAGVSLLFGKPHRPAIELGRLR